MKEYVIITGASRGIGMETAILFAKSGYNLILICHNNSGLLEEVADICRSHNINVITFTGDLSDYNFCVSIYSYISNHSITINILINNAGISYIGLLQDMTIEQWNNVINTNLTSVFSMSSLAIPYFLKNGSGKIINVSSVWGNCGASCEVAYSASKGGINSFTKALGKELAPSNIQVNAIAFGAVDTDMNKCFTKEELNNLANEIPAGRMASAAEAAREIYAVASMGSYFTGQIICFDGGWI